MKRFLKNNGLSITVLLLFMFFLALESLAGHRAELQHRREHGQPDVSYAEFVSSGRFLEATTENWESEFLEMGAYAVLTALLFQRGSSESKPLGKAEAVDRDPRLSRDKPNMPWPVRRGGWVLRVYENSLSLAFATLFLIAFFLHAVGGMRAYNEDQLAHGQAPLSLGEFLCSADFWFQSLQNWQSEFLGLGSMILLTIFLRQRGSPESKPVDTPHSQTGSD
jgi:succinate dehydrogenase hydrophobic anchor subunit